MFESDPTHRIEYWHIIDKTDWKDGDWQQEPDKVTWYDQSTGYPCIVLRTRLGSLNGYVGIPVYHPAYGLSYDGATKHDHEKRAEAFMKSKSTDYNSLPDKPVVPGIGEKILNLRVHGGLTYSNESSIPTKEYWEEQKKQIPKMEVEALRFPNGDAANWLERLMPVINDFDKWSDHVKRRVIYFDETTDETWWFGFDCSHAWDIVPGQHYWEPVPDSQYRNLEYVEGECKSLAKQLKAIETGG